jgi:hypothetical protein
MTFDLGEMALIYARFRSRQRAKARDAQEF